MVYCNTCKITGAVNVLFPQRPCSLFLLHPSSQPLFCISSSPVSTSFSLSVVAHLILVRFARGEKFSSSVPTLSAFHPFAWDLPTSLQPGYSPLKHFELTGLWSLHCSSQAASFRHRKREPCFTVHHAPSTLIYSFVRWIIEYTSCHSTRDCHLGIQQSDSLAEQRSSSRIRFWWSRRFVSCFFNSCLLVYVAFFFASTYPEA